MVGVSVDDNFRYQMPKIVLSHDRNWSHVAMMIMDCLCLSIHSFKFIPVMIKENPFMNDFTVDGGK